MNQFYRSIVALLAFAACAVAQTPPPKPPVGVPADAKLFNGKWYRTYFERVTWTRAKERCASLGGQLVVIPDAPTWTFVHGFAADAWLWLGATDEQTESVWKWVDGTPMTFKAWGPTQPSNSGGKEHYLHIKNHTWNDTPKDANNVVGFICEWKAK